MPDLFKDHTGTTWDLDDPATYTKSWFPNKLLELDGATLRHEVGDEIGRSLYHMLCFLPDVPWTDQYDRVLEFGKRFAKECRQEGRWENKAWLRKQLFLILDETENQC